jgi:hypothetical protein
MWVVPLVVAVVAAVVIGVALRRVMAEAIGLRRELDRFSELRPALLELRNDTRALQAAAMAKLERLPRR